MSSKPAICFPDKQTIENLKTWEALQPLDATSISIIFKTIQVYLAQTKPLRGNHTQLLISYQQSHKPVTADTIARWLITIRILDKPRINTNIFHANQSSINICCEDNKIIR
jgi:hypothetical protein